MSCTSVRSRSPVHPVPDPSLPSPQHHPEIDLESNQNYASESDSDNDSDKDTDSDSEDVAMDATGYFDLLDQLVKDWMSIQLTHNVSLTATYEFWKLALKTFPKLMEVKKAENVERKTPQFIHLKRQLYKDVCPKIYLDLVYLDTTTNESVHVDSTHIPVREYEQNPRYLKQCKTAKIKVRKRDRFFSRDR